jgi:kexin
VYREENPVGEWTIRVIDRVNPDKTGRFKFWSLQLWGEAVDASKTKLWAPALAGQDDEEQVGSEPAIPTTTAQKPKPTNLLPGDHGQAEGESHKPGLGDSTPNPPGQDGVETDEGVVSPGGATEDVGVVEAGADEGYFKGIETLATKTNFIAGAGGIILLAASATGLFLFVRSRRKRSLFRNLSEGERGTYQPVDSMQMGLLGGRKTGDGANGGSKDLYDAFAEGDMTEDEDEETDVRETSALRYHDSFLDDEDAEGDDRVEEKRDVPSEEREEPKDDVEEAAEQTGSTSSASTPRPESQNRLLSP